MSALPVAMLSYDKTYQRYGFSYFSFALPLLQTFALFSLILPFKVGPDEGDNKPMKIDINPIFQTFTFFILMMDPDNPDYLNVHLLISLMNIMASLIYRFYWLINELKD